MQIHEYDDFDAFAGDVSDVDATMMLQNPRRRRWTVGHLNLAGIHVQCGELGNGNIAEGQLWTSGYLLYLPLSTACEYRLNGARIGGGSFGVFEPGSEFCLSTRDMHDWYTVLVPTQSLVRDGDVFGQSPRPETPACRITRPAPRVANRFASLVREATAAAIECETFENSFAARRAAATVLAIARSVIGASPADEPVLQGRPRASRQDIVRCCMELFEERGGESVLVTDLAENAGVSERTLRTAFNKHFAMSPARYLSTRRLHAVNRALRVADPAQQSVTGLLVRHGEWQFGRFAMRYRRLFGELPSETLNRCRG